jgi:acetolactate synthase-1/2/3 large subunit
MNIQAKLGARTAAQQIVQALAANGVDHVFCVPGESYLAVLDALGDAEGKIRVIACRHEAGAANMAEAYGKLTGRPGVCMVTRGPGATHASVGVHTAEQDSTPLILLVGQVARGDRGRGAFQEMDYAAVFGSFAKWAAEIDDPARAGEMMERAFATALQGRRGPVVLAMPEDVLTAEAPGPAPRFFSPARAGLDPEVAATIGDRLRQAERPLVVLGGSGWTAQAQAAIGAWLQAQGLPAVTSFRRKDLIDNDSPAYIGEIGLGSNPVLLQRVRDADLVLALGARLADNPTQGYTLFTPEQTAARLIHIYPGTDELGRVWPASLAAVADVSLAAQALARLELSSAERWSDWRTGGRADYEAFVRPIPAVGPVNLSEVVAHMSRTLPADAILCNGAGNYAAWLHRFHSYRRFGTELAPTSGAMGYGVPAAIAAKLVHPEREVVCLAGDGDFLMTGQELATAVQYGANVLIVVADNGSYGTIRAHQERHYPGRVVATDLRNPDFAALARAFGAWGERVERTEDFPAAFEQARRCGRPALIHLVTDVEDIAPGRTLAQLRETSSQGSG